MILWMHRGSTMPDIKRATESRAACSLAGMFSFFQCLSVPRSWILENIGESNRLVVSDPTPVSPRGIKPRVKQPVYLLRSEIESQSCLL